jgi:hypothetical protein
VVDVVFRPPLLSSALLGLVLFWLIARLSFSLARTPLHDPTGWHLLAAALVETALIPILVAAMTWQGQRRLGEMYGLRGRGWLPVLLHKYFGAAVAAIVAWLFIWLIWLAVYGAGWGEARGMPVRQALWGVALVILAVAAHAGARQAIRQNLLFLRVGYAAVRQAGLELVLLVVLLLFAPLIPIFMATLIVFLWRILSGTTALVGTLLFVTIQMIALLLHIVPGQQERDTG